MQAREQVQRSLMKQISLMQTGLIDASLVPVGCRPKNLRRKKRSHKLQRPLLRKRSGARGPHWTGPRDEGREFKAGDPVKESGIYEAIHEGAHREPHEVVMVKADLFPACDTCAEKVRFKLVRSAPYIFNDIDFEQQE